MTLGSGVPGFGIAFNDQGDPQSSTMTLTGGDGSTLLLGNVAPSTATFTPTLPLDAGTCQPCDAQQLPVVANTVTWFDFECGAASCE